MELRLMFHSKRVHNTRGVTGPLNTLKQSEKRENGITTCYELLQKSLKNYTETRGERKLL
jgi:hypothetical protein